MMELPTLLHTLTAEGFTLGVVGCNALEVRGPTAKLTPELRAGLREHKPTLLAMLAQPEADEYVQEEGLAIQGEASAPAEAEAWPDAFMLHEGHATADASIDWWATLSPSQRRELTAERTLRQR